jgi:hypothetical protein
LREESDQPAVNDALATTAEISRQFASLDRKLLALSRVVTSIIVVAVWAFVFYVVLPKLDQWVGPNWSTASAIAAFFGAAIASGVIQQRIEREFQKTEA